MKKLFVLVLVIMILGLAGCKKEPAIETETVGETEETMQQEVMGPQANGEWGSAGPED